MPYGIITEATAQYLTDRAQQSGLMVEVLGLEPEIPEVSTDQEDWPEVPSNTYEISVIFGGALDEEFYVQTDYEVNIADWLAEQCREESAKQGGESWEITVSEFAWEDSGAVRYRVSDES